MLNFKKERTLPTNGKNIVRKKKLLQNSSHRYTLILSAVWCPAARVSKCLPTKVTWQEILR